VQTRPSGQQANRLCDYIDDHREELLARWEHEVRALPEATPLSSSALRDHVPDLLAKIAEIVRTVHEPGPVRYGDLPDLHALDRLEAGFELPAVLAELTLLRRVTLEAWKPFAAFREPTSVVDEIDKFDEAVDVIVARSADRYARARERTLVALDRVSSAALGTGELEEFLPRLLRVLLETTRAADSAYIMLRDEGTDLLRVRAAAGTGAAQSLEFALRVGEGVAGRVTERREPMLVHDASTNPLVLNPSLRHEKVHAVYFFPLLDGDEVVGVAKLASRSAFDFSEDDRQLLRAMAQRATAIIVRAQLRARERDASGAFRRTAAELNRVMELSPDMLAVLGADGRLKRANPALGAALGYSEAELLATPPAALVHPDDRERVTAEVRSVFAGALARRLLFRMVRRDGAVRWVSFNASSEPDSGEMVAAGRDVTEEAERAEFEQHLLGIVSHDLRTPLSAILMASSALLRRADDLGEANSKLVERIRAAAERSAALIRDLLDFSTARGVAGIAITPRPLDLHALARRVAEEVHASFPERRIEFEQRGDGTGHWDPGRVAQVVENLVANAFKYGAPDAPIVVRTLGEDRWARLEVHNRGDPIDPALLPHLFEPLRQGSRPASAGGEGVGLGLYIVDHLVRAHGGTVEVRSTADAGTTFVVRLPREPPVGEQAA
jgi:PAS domain S-box-containing protein